MTMARRKNISIFEDLFGIAALLPWWVGTVLAVASYVALRHYASVDVQTDVAHGRMGQMIVGQMTKALAFYGQFIVPLLLLAGAVASFVGRRKREGLFREVADDRSGRALRDLSWSDFELLVGEALRLRGFSVAETGGDGADGGVDLRLKKGGEVFLVQCKQWRAYKVSVNVVRELLGVMTSQGAAGGFVVTSGVFTADAHSFAEGQNIELIDGTALTAMIQRVRATQPAGVSATDVSSRLEPHLPTTALVTEPACPRCGSAMAQRIGRQGSKAGRAFWGCTAFPRCRGVREID